jgi:hypothetical protein
MVDASGVADEVALACPELEWTELVRADVDVGVGEAVDELLDGSGEAFDVHAPSSTTGRARLRAVTRVRRIRQSSLITDLTYHRAEVLPLIIESTG